MYSRRPYSLALAIVAVLFAIVVRKSNADFEFASIDLFAVNYATAQNQSLTVTVKDATAFSLLPIPGGVAGRWTVKVLGTTAHVYLALQPVDATTGRWWAAVIHDRPLPQGWFVQSLDQRFCVRQIRPLVADGDVFHVGKVYGPTAYVARADQTVEALYPNFLQTQQVTLTNDADDVAFSILAEDMEGHRKSMGFKSSTNDDVRELYVRHLPENLGTAHVFVPRFPVLVKQQIANGLDGAIKWYRAVQQQHAGSFLSRRRAAAGHPFLARNKFMVAVGAAALTQAPVGDRYDVTDNYIRNVLDAFGTIHGRDLMVYHMGWANDVYQRRALWPDISESILPGYQRLLNAARARGYRNVPYFLPTWVNQRSAYYSPDELCTDRLGNPIVGRADPSCPDLFGRLSWYSGGPARIYDQVILSTMIQTLGFDGAYMDALSASNLSFNMRHNPPAGQNEQLVGINRWFAAARSRLATMNRTAMFSNETPTEVFFTHMSGLDLSQVTGGGLNLFRRTYTGREWPTTHIILAYHALIYNFELARCLREGTRPTVFWPEWDGRFPSDLRSAPDYQPFRAMLTQYAVRYDKGFNDAIDGLLMAQLDSFQATLIPAIPALQAFPRAWKSAVPAVLHGVFAPDADTDERVIVLSRWTSPDSALIDGFLLLSNHPLHNQIERVSFKLGKAGLGLDPGKKYDVVIYDAETDTQRRVGRLPANASNEIGISTDLAPASHQIVRVVPVA